MDSYLRIDDFYKIIVDSDYSFGEPLSTVFSLNSVFTSYGHMLETDSGLLQRGNIMIVASSTLSGQLGDAINFWQYARNFTYTLVKPKDGL